MYIHYNKFFRYFLLSVCTFSSAVIFSHIQIVETNYGPIDVCEPVILDLIKHPMMQRLKKIHQYGVGYYLTNKYEYHRYEHSLGVFALLRVFGASLEEQIAGLLHDVSHTIFSHVGDYFFNYQHEPDSYQDAIHESFLNQTGIAQVLEKHGFQVKDILHKNTWFRRLEQQLPNICADRLEYILRGGLLEHVLSQEDVDTILKCLCFEHDEWFFIDQGAAKNFAMTSLYLTEKLITSPDHVVSYTLMADMLHYAINQNILTLNDIHFGYDDEVWLKLKSCKDSVIDAYFEKLYNLNKSYKVSSHRDPEAYYFYGKFRGVDPLIQTADGLRRLTEIDEDYQREFIRVKNKVAAGWYVRFL